MEQPLPTNRIAELTRADRVELVETIQSLWSGYGQIARVRLLGDSERTAIVKHVCPPVSADHKYGWSGDVSHARKLRSYEVELNWYLSFADRCGTECRVPKLIAGEHTDPTWLIILEDLDAAGFSIRRNQVNDAQLDACLNWLANFHATFLHEADDSQSPVKGLWNIGTYWHLETRPDELAAMPDGPLKTAAASIDARLNNARFQTLVHGDAKLANFCFSDSDQVAAVDFQYVGSGCGMKDVAYFISSCFGDQECETRESELLDCYFKHLKTAMAAPESNGRSVETSSFTEVETEWRALYPFAWADFYRFLSGWSPGHWKMHGYSERMAQRVLAELASQ